MLHIPYHVCRCNFESYVTKERLQKDICMYNLTRSFKTNKRTSQVCFHSDACFFLDIHKHFIIYQAYFGLLVIKVLETSSLALSDPKSNSFKSFTKSDLAWQSKKLLPTSFFIPLGNYIDRSGKAVLLYPYTVSPLCLTPQMNSMLTQIVSGALFLKKQLKKSLPSTRVWVCQLLDRDTRSRISGNEIRACC